MATKTTVLVTGANAGIGYEIALHFARLGAQVVMACRNMEKAEQARRTIEVAVPGSKTKALQLDVSELASVRMFARQFAEQVGGLHILINNAGITAQPLARSREGHELQLATNYLGAFALTGLLLPYFRNDKQGRIVNVGSLAHRMGKLDFSDMNWERNKYDQWKAYANSKLAALSHAIELNRRLDARGSHVMALAAHPGFAATDILYKSESLRPKTWIGRLYMKTMTNYIPTPANAARPVLQAATAHDAQAGAYYGPGGFMEIAGVPSLARIRGRADDPALCARLWEVSETLTGVRYLSTPPSELRRGQSDHEPV